MNKKLKRQRTSKKDTEDLKNKYSKRSLFQSVFSKLSFKNITIIRSFTVILAISLFTTLVIGISSFSTINRTYNNLKLMYTNCLQREILFSSINVHLNSLRENISNHLEYPKDSFRDNINQEIDGISKELTQYKLLGFTGDDAKMDEITNELFLTFKNRCDSITQIENGNPPNKDTKDKYKINFQADDSNFSTVISTAVNKNKADAEQLFNQTEKAYVSGIVILVVFLISSIILIFLIVTVVIKSLKKSIRSFTSILDTLAMGDFTVDIETNEKSEIGLMKKDLSSTISSISNILKVIKTGSVLTLEKSRSLASASKEMDSTMQEVAVAIHGIAEGASINGHK